MSETSHLAGTKALILQCPTSVQLEIFSFLELETIRICWLVCKDWHNLFHNSNSSALFWKNHVLRKYGHFCETAIKGYVDSNFLNWKEAYRYLPLLIFIHARNNSINESPKEIKDLQFGFMEFSICNSTDVKVKNNHSGEFFNLKGEENEPLIAIEVENDCIFAYTLDGRVIQWNFYIKQRIQILETKATADRHLREQFDNKPNHLKSFKVTRGAICLLWEVNLQTTFQTIAYEEPSLSKVFSVGKIGYDIFPFTSNQRRENEAILYEILRVSKEKIYLRIGEDLLILNLLTEQVIKINFPNGQFYISDSFFYKFSASSIEKYDLNKLDKSKKPIFCINLEKIKNSVCNVKLFILDHWLFAFAHVDTNDVVNYNLIWNLNSKSNLHIVTQKERDSDIFVKFVSAMRNPKSTSEWELKCTIL